MVNEIRTIYPKWIEQNVQFKVLCGLPSSTWNTWRRPKVISAKICEYINDDNSPKILSDEMIGK